MTTTAADGFTQLVVHLLAHVQRPGPGDLFSPRHIAWSEAHFRPATSAQLHDDAAVLSALWAASPALDLLDALPALHTSLSAYRRTAARALSELTERDVAQPDLLRALHHLGPAAELVHAMLGLLVDEFARVHDTLVTPLVVTACERISTWLDPLADSIPALATERIEVVWALGDHGRVMPGRLLVGVGDSPDDLTPVVVAVHEHAVRTSGHEAHERAEWSALVHGARWLREAPSPLREAQARWLARLDLSELIEAALADGAVDGDTATALEHDPPERAARLSALPG